MSRTESGPLSIFHDQKAMHALSIFHDWLANKSERNLEESKLAEKLSRTSLSIRFTSTERRQQEKEPRLHSLSTESSNQDLKKENMLVFLIKINCKKNTTEPRLTEGSHPPWGRR
jgi:hypothetical protein